MPPRPERLAAFDLDGTLTRRDTMLAFCAFVLGGKLPLAWNMLRIAPVLLAWKLGFATNQAAKEALLRVCFAGKTEQQLRSLGKAFGEQILPGLLRPAGWARLEAHRAAGDAVVVVTASLDLWVEPWARAQGLELLSSKAEVKEGKFTGKLAGQNCMGAEKVRRLEAWLGGHRPGLVVAYGDSKGDKEMLAWADEAHWKPFR